MDLCEFASQKGFQVCRDFDPVLLVPEERVRSYCTNNRCGNYGKNYMCPPLAPPLEEVKDKLLRFNRAVLVQQTVNLNVKRDWKIIKRSMTDFHNKILDLEKFLKVTGIKETWGIIAGTCGLCEICSVGKNKPCIHPDKARSSIEALGIDVGVLLKTLNLDAQFHSDKVTWTGCVLYQKID